MRNGYHRTLKDDISVSQFMNPVLDIYDEIKVLVFFFKIPVLAIIKIVLLCPMHVIEK